MRFFVILLLVSVLQSYAECPLPDTKYPPPSIELTYLNDSFTEELIIKKSFRDNQLVPIKIELIKPQMSDSKVNDLYLTIESVQVSFAIHKSTC